MDKTIDTKYPHLTRWTMPDSYFGATWEDYFGAGVGQSRDSDTLTRSNFECLQQALGELPDFIPPSQTDDEEEIQSRRVISESHWAVGWVEWIPIHESDTAALELCEEIAAGLEDYPVIDESDWSDLEYDEFIEAWNDYGAGDFVKAIIKTFELSGEDVQVLEDCDDKDLLRGYFMEVAPEPYHSEGSGVYIGIDSAVRAIEDITPLLDKLQNASLKEVTRAVE